MKLVDEEQKRLPPVEELLSSSKPSTSTAHTPAQLPPLHLDEVDEVLNDDWLSLEPFDSDASSNTDSATSRSAIGPTANFSVILEPIDSGAIREKVQLSTSAFIHPGIPALHAPAIVDGNPSVGPPLFPLSPSPSKMSCF